MSKNIEPFFTICIPTFNAQKFIAESLSSVASQVFDDWEVIVCDDCSTDATLNVIKSFAECKQVFAGRLTVICMDENSGPFLARRRAFSQARGKYVICLDADDMLKDETVLNEIRNVIAKRACDVLLFNMTDQVAGKHRLVDYSCLCSNKSGYVPKAMVVDTFASGYQLNNLATKAIRRECLGIGDYSFSNGLRMCEDRLEMVGVLEKAKTFFIYDEALYYYRPNSLSTTNGFFSFEYCRQQALVENEVFKFLNSFQGLHDFKLSLERNSLALISHDMRRLAQGRSVRCLADEMKKLSALSWFADCLSGACLDGFKVDIRIRIRLLQYGRYYLAAIFSKLLSGIRRPRST